MLNPAFGGTDPTYIILKSNFMQRWGVFMWRILKKNGYRWVKTYGLQNKIYINNGKEGRS